MDANALQQLAALVNRYEVQSTGRGASALGPDDITIGRIAAACPARVCQVVHLLRERAIPFNRDELIVNIAGNNLPQVPYVLCTPFALACIPDGAMFDNIRGAAIAAMALSQLRVRPRDGAAAAAAGPLTGVKVMNFARIQSQSPAMSVAQRQAFLTTFGLNNNQLAGWADYVRTIPQGVFNYPWVRCPNWWLFTILILVSQLEDVRTQCPPPVPRAPSAVLSPLPVLPSSVVNHKSPLVAI